MDGDIYYDGAHDALTEAMQEVSAAWVMGHPGIKREHYTTDVDFWSAVMQATLDALRDSYGNDAKFLRRLRQQRDAQ